MSQHARPAADLAFVNPVVTFRQASLPLDPALAAAALAAARLGCMPDLLTVAAMLSADSIFASGRCAPDSLGAEQRLHAHAELQARIWDWLSGSEPQLRRGVVAMSCACARRLFLYVVQ